MNIAKIKNYVESGNISRINNSINQFCSRADKLMESKPNVTGLLPNSMKKCKGTNLTNTELIALILRNA